jgi:bifunctional non-homologous end joining protein LigD
MTLDIYKKKRCFNETPEPKGIKLKKSEAIFVVQKHAASHLHYDFRLAIDGVLKSWAIPKGPCLDLTVKRLAVEVEDHPLAYATFEGLIPKGHYGAGTVIVWDYGHWDSTENLSVSLRKGHMNFNLQGKKLKGGWSLVRIRSDAAKPQWLLIKNKDAFSRALTESDILVDRPGSVLTANSKK